MDASLFADHEREFLELTKTLQERVAAAGHGDIAGKLSCPRATHHAYGCRLACRRSSWQRVRKPETLRY